MRLAAIDIGTNSIHLVIVEAANGTFEVIDREKEMVKLGAGLFRTRRLSDRAYEEGLDALRRYCKLAEARDVDEVLAVATSACREARNGEQFLDDVLAQTGVRPRVISGLEEARLIHRAVRHALDLRGQRVLVLDIGGGSVEAIVGDEERALARDSMRLGVQRLRDRLGGEPISTKRLHELRGYVRGVAQDFFETAREHAFTRVVGTSGTIKTLGEAAHLLAGGAPFRTVNAQRVRLKDLTELSKRLVALPEKDRAAVPGLGAARSDAIHLGSVLLVELLELARATEITLCDASLREGVILDYLDRHGTAAFEPAPPLDVRRRSVVELARKYDRDDARERHIAAIALQLFDQTRSLHGLSDEHRSLLEYAALLHGVGEQIGFKGRHKHSRYIIRHSQLRGFNDEETELLASIVRYHRRKPPDARDKDFRRLFKPQRRLVEVLSALLRLAVALDRGRSQVVKRVACRVVGDVLEVTAYGTSDLDLEIWAADERKRPLGVALGRRVRIVSGAAPEPEA